MAEKKAIDIQGDMIFRLSRKRSPQEVKLKSLEWAVVTQLNGEKTVEQIADILALSEEETQEIFSHLMNEGLLELVRAPEEATFIDPQLLSDLEYQLKLHVGPVASVILDDALAELHKSRQNLERKFLPVLVEILSQEISNPRKRREFQKYALIKIMELYMS